MDRFFDREARVKFLFTAPSNMARAAPIIATATITSRSVKPPLLEEPRPAGIRTCPSAGVLGFLSSEKLDIFVVHPSSAGIRLCF